MQKIRAFTIIEMIVALAISALVVVIAFYALSSLKKVQQVKQSSLESSEELREFQFVIKADFLKYNGWKQEENQMTISDESNSVIYEFFEDSVQRNSRGKQTIFKFSSVQLNTQFYKGSNILKQVNIGLIKNNKESLLTFPVNEDVFYRLKSENSIWE